MVLLHGCPFSSFVWRRIVPTLSSRFRCVAPDLLGLGDTEAPAGAERGLPAQQAAVLGLLDQLALEQVALVGHDHGGAVAQLIAADRPERLSALALADTQAYDNWPSGAQLSSARAAQRALLGRLMLWCWSHRRPLRRALTRDNLVHDPSLLAEEFVGSYAAHLADHRGRADTCCPTVWGERLRSDILGCARLEVPHHTGHLLMEERPTEIAALIGDFLNDHKKRPQEVRALARPLGRHGQRQGQAVADTATADGSRIARTRFTPSWSREYQAQVPRRSRLSSPASVMIFRW